MGGGTTVFQVLAARISGIVEPLFDRRKLFDALNALSLLDANRVDATLTELALARRRAGDAARNGPPRPPPVGLRDFFLRYVEHYGKEQVATRRNVRRTMLLLCRALGPEMPVEAIGPEDAAAALGRFRNARTFNGHVGNIVAALRWGKREGLVDSPLAATLKRRTEVWEEPCFFDPAAVERIFRICESHPGDAATAAGMRLSLGFFAGVRSVEIERAEWADLDLDSAVLRIPRPKGWTSGTRPRLVELEENAVAWLRKWKEWTARRRRGAEPRGRIVPGPARFAGWKRRYLDPEGLSWGRNRAQNVMRHTYATMHVGAFRNAGATALNMGHARGTGMLERHYRGLVSRETAAAYWRIFPSS